MKMGIRGEIFSNRVILANRTYFFNVKENRMGDLYLNIVESKNRDTGGFERQSVILFADDLQEFLKGFDESLRVLEKAVREKRRSGREAGEARSEKYGRGERTDRPEKPGRFEKKRQNFSGERNRDENPRRFEKKRQSFSGEKPAKTRRQDGNKPERSRRVVVKRGNRD
jgi:hypothetical protein